jgi:hypothetical protein
MWPVVVVILEEDEPAPWVVLDVTGLHATSGELRPRGGCIRNDHLKPTCRPGRRVGQQELLRVRSAITRVRVSKG